LAIALVGRSRARRGAEFADGVEGLFYAGFVAFVRSEFGLSARVAAALPVSDVAAAAAGNEVVLASVHHSIRWPDRPVFSRGGHLVLVLDADQTHMYFNNPSGHTPCTQQGIGMEHDCFSRFYSQRGIVVEVECRGMVV
jgi:hypothetical protein